MKLHLPNIHKDIFLLLVSDCFSINEQFNKHITQLQKRKGKYIIDLVKLTIRM